jgi:FtsZ-binding cell division protein ZapB
VYRYARSARLELPLRFLEHHVERVVFEQLDRIELRIEQARNRIRLRQRLADERKRRREANAVPQRDALEVRERLARLDVLEGPPVVARQLPAELVLEAGLVGAEHRE